MTWGCRARCIGGREDLWKGRGRRSSSIPFFGFSLPSLPLPRPSFPLLFFAFSFLALSFHLLSPFFSCYLPSPSVSILFPLLSSSSSSFCSFSFSSSSPPPLPFPPIFLLYFHSLFPPCPFFSPSSSSPYTSRSRKFPALSFFLSSLSFLFSPRYFFSFCFLSLFLLSFLFQAL